MAARILNGNEIRDQIYGELAGEIASLAAAGIRPGLAAVLVGDNPASKLYVKQQNRGVREAGIGERSDHAAGHDFDRGIAGDCGRFQSPR